ncbi:iron complex outermembrane receptor protein [Sphingomonas sp. SORGH_AS 950]|uniref:TonB-dependent receptor n=1 Tax=Sphingomonas sp. SORGH_AS_0950 TaxID=3041792 RepID=UPI0027834543|nr:TonB-dependent receptor [Sphingomonas sp. SORGH_AS_0950]MDQ1158248.1 iron complex outermembrane receptor protein [Sphingomonas sp. SORGH_AS_0950]
MWTKRTLLLASSALFAVQPAVAQDAPKQDGAADQQGEVVVTGYRTSLAAARDSKRDASIIKDSIAASDIAAFPDLNLAEALQRLPGVAINREAGEGRRISLRGLGPDFTRVQLDGMEVLGNVDSPQDSRGQTTRDRAFDFNLFAAELFNHVDVEKSYQAKQTEGGLAGTVGLYTARPFDFKGTKIAMSAQGGTNTLTRDFQPRLTGLISKNWGDFGILVSAAYSRRNTREEGFDTYRWRRNKANGSNISGLTAAEQAKINSGDLLFARGNRLSVWDSKQERIGLTTSVQWAPTDKVHLTLDGLYGQFKGDRFETHLASRGGGSSTWLGGGETFAGVVYPNSRVNALQWNDRNEVVYLDVSGGKASTETRIQNTKNIFKQLVLSGDAELAEGLTFTWLGGVERSAYSMPVNDKFTVEGFGDVTSDYRGGTYSLVNTYKFNPADANFWHAKRLYVNNTYQDTAFDNIKGRFDYKFSPDDTISIGGEWRRFANTGYYGEQDNILTSQFQSGKVSANVAGYAQVYGGYTGQDWTIVDFPRMLQTLGIDRSQYLTSKLGVFAVEERTGAAFVQYDWNHVLGGVPFRGNIGARYYRTTVTSDGLASVGPVTVRGEYQGVLPAANLIFELNPGLMLRFAASQNINRPALGALAVNGSVSNNNGDITVSIGNPNLRPYKSNDFDISAEQYFGSVGYVAAALFYKHLDGYISTQTVSDVPYSQTGLPDNLYPGVTGKTIIDSFSRPVNLLATNLFGVELSGQTDFKFLPAPFDRLGTAVNFTYVDSRLDYSKIYAGSIPTTLEGLSKYNANATLYYQDKAFDARVSANYRSGYIFSASPVLTSLGPDQDVTGFEGTVYVDMSAHYALTKNVQLTLNGINLTNQREKQYSNSTKRLYVVTRSGTTLLGGVRVTF